jgi:hypothetical protein
MSDHKGGTDAVHKVTLPSAIQRAAWVHQAASIGDAAPLEVITSFVGDGADVTVEVRTKSGKTLGKVTGKIGVNVFHGTFTVPEKTAEPLYFEAQLNKHGLKARSGLMAVLPRRAITNAKWDRKEARRGDVLKLTADTEYIADGAKVKIGIYEHDADGAHDLVTEFETEIKGKKVETSWEYEYHEDTDEIPTKEEAEKGYKPPQYFFRVSAGTAFADSDLLEFKDWIEIVLTDDTGKPAANKDFVVHLPDGSEKRGKLDSDGRAMVKDLPPGPVDVEFPDTEITEWS